MRGHWPPLLSQSFPIAGEGVDSTFSMILPARKLDFDVGIIIVVWQYIGETIGQKARLLKSFASELFYSCGLFNRVLPMQTE